jgi:membrane protease YdiL (CAAX protease family)
VALSLLYFAVSDSAGDLKKLFHPAAASPTDHAEQIKDRQNVIQAFCDRFSGSIKHCQTCTETGSWREEPTSSQAPEVRLELAFPKTDEDELDTTVGYLEKTFKDVGVAKLTINMTGVREPKIYVTTAETSPQPFELLTSLWVHDLERKSGKSATSKSSHSPPVTLHSPASEAANAHLKTTVSASATEVFVANCLSGFERPLIDNLLIAFERSRQHYPNDLELTYDMAIAKLTAHLPIDSELRILGDMSAESAVTPERESAVGASQKVNGRISDSQKSVSAKGPSSKGNSASNSMIRGLGTGTSQTSNPDIGNAETRESAPKKSSRDLASKTVSSKQASEKAVNKETHETDTPSAAVHLRTRKCQMRRAADLLRVLKTIVYARGLTEAQARKDAQTLIESLPDDAYRQQSLNFLSEKAGTNNLPGLNKTDSEKDMSHVIIIIGVLLLCSLSSPIFLWLLLRKLASGSKQDRTASLMQSMDTLSQVNYNWSKIGLIVAWCAGVVVAIALWASLPGTTSDVKNAITGLRNPISTALMEFCFSTAINSPVLFVYLAFCLPKGISFSEGFGLRFRTAQFTTAELIKIGAVAYLALNAVTTIVMILILAFHHPETMLDQSSQIARATSVPAALIIIFVECIYGPLMEELCFRGVLYRGLRGVWGVFPSLIVSSLWFAALHGEMAPWLLFHKFAIGALNCWLFERTKSLVPSVVAHCLNNTVINIL